MTIVRAFGSGLLAAALLMTPALARAAPGEPGAAAATDASDEAVAKALARFNYRVLYNIGVVCYQMQDYVCGLQSFQEYLTQGGAEIPQGRRQSVEHDIGELKQRIGYLDIRTDVAGAEISVDDAVVGTSPLKGPVAVSSGRHRAVIILAGSAPVTRSVDVGGQDTARLDIVLAPVASAREPHHASGPASPAEPPPSKRGSMTTLSWIGYGVGAAMVAGAAVTGGLALDSAGNVKTKVYPDEAAAQADRSHAATFAAVSDGLLLGAVLTVAATTVLTFVLPRSSSTNVGFRLTPGGLSNAYTF
jgi:hypothetical protein